MSHLQYAVLLLLNLICFGLAWNLVWRRTMLDEMRQRLFEIRDRLFDDVAEGNLGIGFESVAYVEFREMINSFIRLGPILNLWIIGILQIHGRRTQNSCAYLDAFKDLPDGPVKKRLVQAEWEMSAAVWEYVFLTALWMWPPAIVGGFAMLLVEGIRLLSQGRLLAAGAFMNLLRTPWRRFREWGGNFVRGMHSAHQSRDPKPFAC